MARRADPAGDHGTPDAAPRPKSTHPAQNSGGGTSQTGTDRVFQSSERGKPLPLAYGTVRVGPNIIERYDSVLVTVNAALWTKDTDYLVPLSIVTSYGQTYAVITPGHSSPTGSLGQGPKGTGTDIVDGTVHWKYLPPGVYTAMALGFCEGPAYGVGMAWQDSLRLPHYDELAGSSSNFALFLGTPAGVTRPSWFQFPGADLLPDYYSNTVVLFINGSSGADASVPNVSLEIQGLFVDATHVDASPADIAIDMLTHPRRGVLWPIARVDSVSTGGADPSSWRNYCTAYGLNLSWVIDTQSDVLTLLGLLLDATNSDAIQTNRPDGLGFMLKFVPRGDQALTANGVTFTPNTTATPIGPDDLIEPVQIQRSPPIDRYNSCPIEFLDRAGDYVRTTVDDPDMADVELRGLRRATTFALPQVIAPESAVMLSRIRAQRSLNVTRTFTLKLPDRFLLLEPTDLLTVSDPVMGLVSVPMRIAAVGEEIGEDGGVTVTAEDWPGLVHAAASYTPQMGDGYKPNQGTPISRSPVVPAQVPGGVLADVSSTRGAAVHNMWPNGSSENNPPDGADTTTPEWAARVDAGSGAYAGSWVREISEVANAGFTFLGDKPAGTTAIAPGAILGLKVRASPGDLFVAECQVRGTSKVSGPSARSMATLGWFAFDSNENVINTSGMTHSFDFSASAVPTAYQLLSTRLGGTTAPCPAGTVGVWFIVRVIGDGGIGLSGTATAQFDAINVYRVVDSESDAASSAPSIVVSAGGNTFAQLPGTAQNFVPNTGSRKIKVSLAFSGFATGGTGPLNVRVVVGGTPVQVGVAYSLAYNTVSQHQGWSFQWALPPGMLGPVGTAVAVSAEIRSPTGSLAAFNMDSNDSASMVIEEIG